ncbi:hypothetical protein THIOSC15_1980014 [uncultured Thiomicrorhabdus sp.]
MSRIFFVGKCLPVKYADKGYIKWTMREILFWMGSSKLNEDKR